MPPQGMHNCALKKSWGGREERQASLPVCAGLVSWLSPASSKPDETGEVCTGEVGWGRNLFNWLCCWREPEVEPHPLPGHGSAALCSWGSRGSWRESAVSPVAQGSPWLALALACPAL